MGGCWILILRVWLIPSPCIVSPSCIAGFPSSSTTVVSPPFLVVWPFCVSGISPVTATVSTRCPGFPSVDVVGLIPGRSPVVVAVVVSVPIIIVSPSASSSPPVIIIISASRCCSCWCWLLVMVSCRWWAPLFVIVQFWVTCRSSCWAVSPGVRWWCCGFSGWPCYRFLTCISGCHSSPICGGGALEDPVGWGGSMAIIGFKCHLRLIGF